MAQDTVPQPQGNTRLSRIAPPMPLDNLPDWLENEDEMQGLAHAYAEGKLASIPNLPVEIERAQQMAHNTLTKRNRINIRISDLDLSSLKCRAAREGLPYQTLIASILHKYAAGTLQDVPARPESLS